MRFAEARARLVGRPAVLPAGSSRLRARVVGARAADAVRRTAGGATRQAAALVLLYPDALGETRLVLTVRPSGDHVHAGQVALPGGKREPGDEFPHGTALREATEEVGLDPAAAGVEVLGVLDTVDVRVSGFLMVPVLATAPAEPRLEPDEREVAELLRVPVRHFLPAAPIGIADEERDGWHLRYGYFPVEGHRVWGATASVLGQLGALLGADPRAAGR